MKQRPSSSRRRDPAADSAAAEAVDTPTAAQSLGTPPVDPVAEPTGHYGPGYGDPTPVDPARADRPAKRTPRRRRDDDAPSR